MQMLKRLWVALFPDGRRALDKRRLETLLRNAGLSRSVAKDVVSEYFN